MNNCKKKLFLGEDFEDFSRECIHSPLKLGTYVATLRVLKLCILTTWKVLTICCNVSLLMRRECPCSTKTWEVLETHPLPPSRFPLTLEILPSRSFLGIEDGFANHPGWARHQFKRLHSNRLLEREVKVPLGRICWRRNCSSVIFDQRKPIIWPWPPCLKSGHPANYCRHQKSNAKAYRENFSLQITVYSW